MFEQSLQHVGSPAYLGNDKVVEKLVRGFLDNLLRCETELEMKKECHRMASIFCGMNKDYQVDPNWTGRNGLSQELSSRLGLTFNVYEHDLLRAAFGKFAIEAYGIVKAGGGMDQMNKLVRWITAILIGAGSTLYPNSRRWDYED